MAHKSFQHLSAEYAPRIRHITNLGIDRYAWRNICLFMSRASTISEVWTAS